MKKLIFIFIFPLLLAGCVKLTPSNPTGGVYRSTDKAVNWDHKIFIKKGKKQDITIGNTAVIEMVHDPVDKNTVYIGTQNSGSFVTRDGGDKWERFGITQGKVKNIDVNPKENNEIYLTQNNAIYKSTNKGKEWKLIYTEPRVIEITDLVVDSFDPKRVYISLADGLFMKSINSGFSWSVIKNFEDNIKKVLIDPRDTRKIYLFTQKSGIYYSKNLGKDWTQVRKEIKDKFSGSLTFRDAIFDFSRSDSLLYVSKFGILRSDDGANTWNSLSLLTPPGSIDIFTIAINSTNNQEIYYSTPTKIYKTEDGGNTWIVLGLPTNQKVGIIRIDPHNQENIFIGVRPHSQKKKKSFF